ncbi:MAG: hypothetical protein ACRDB0_03145 [Paraclostridium sp.]
MSRNLEISYSFGYVFDKSKLIVMCPVGELTMSEDDYEMEVEVAFLEDGIERAFEEEDIKQAHDIIKPLTTFLMKPSKIIPFVTSIKEEGKDEIKKLMEDFDEEYEIKENYIKKGYEICDIYKAFENVISYIPKENIETLNILKIEEYKFNIEAFINEVRNNLDEAIDKGLIPTAMRKSNLTDRLFVQIEENVLNKENLSKEDLLNVLKESSIYVLFGMDISSYSNGILCANSEVVNDEELDKGDLDISITQDFGYIIEKIDDKLTFKIANFNHEGVNGQKIAQVVDYSGVFKGMMINFVNQFTI